MDYFSTFLFVEARWWQWSDRLCVSVLSVLTTPSDALICKWVRVRLRLCKWVSSNGRRLLLFSFHRFVRVILLIRSAGPHRSRLLSSVICLLLFCFSLAIATLRAPMDIAVFISLYRVFTEFYRCNSIFAVNEVDFSRFRFLVRGFFSNPFSITRFYQVFVSPRVSKAKYRWPTSRLSNFFLSPNDFLFSSGNVAVSRRVFFFLSLSFLWFVAAVAEPFRWHLPLCRLFLSTTNYRFLSNCM